MKEHKRRFRESELVDDPDFAEALTGGGAQRLSSERQVQRRTRQFCRQVQRALNLALEDRSVGEGINGLFVEDVSPAPGCGRLLVHVAIPEGRPVRDAMAALQRETPRLRSEVAMAITRKRAPELSFAPAFPDGVDHE